MEPKYEPSATYPQCLAELKCAQDMARYGLKGDELMYLRAAERYLTVLLTQAISQGYLNNPDVPGV